MPKRSMPQKANSIDSGIARATISAGPQVAEEHEQHGDDQQAALEQVLATVSMTWSTSRCGRRPVSTSTSAGSVALISSSLCFSAQVTRGCSRP